MTRHDEAFSNVAQRFLCERQLPYERPLYGRNGEFLFRRPEKLRILERLLLRAVAHGRDNELFVLFVDLLELTDEWSGFVRAVKVALGRRHQVVLICPWPAGIPLPSSKMWPEVELTMNDPWHRRFHDPQYAIRRLDLIRYRRAYKTLQEELVRVGVTVVCASVADSVKLVVDRIEQLRLARIRR